MLVLELVLRLMKAGFPSRQQNSVLHDATLIGVATASFLILLLLSAGSAVAALHQTSMTTMTMMFMSDQLAPLRAPILPVSIHTFFYHHFM